MSLGEAGEEALVRGTDGEGLSVYGRMEAFTLRKRERVSEEGP